MNERIKLIRKHYNLSQTAFGAQIGVTLGVIRNLETGKTTLSSPLFELLCSIYKVNPEWLTSGDGNMFIPDNASSLNELVQEHNLSPAATDFIKNFLALPHNKQEMLIEILSDIVN